MRLIFTILSFWAFSANATNYYIKNGGNDALDGLTDATAWASLSNIKSGSFNAGDSILLKRGDTFNDSIRVITSGINIGAYGTGNNPIVTGFRLMTLTYKGGNIYQGYSSGLVADLNCVLVNGKMQIKARYPNTGFITAQSATTTTLTSSSLTGTPNYIGFECVVRTAHYIYDKAKVASQSGSTLTFRDPLTYNGFQYGTNGFFFQNDSTFLDQEGEWYNDSLSHRFLVYSASAPLVYESIIDTLVNVYLSNDVSFSNITFTGANRIAINLDSLRNTNINYCNIENIGKIGVKVRKGSRISIENDTIRNVFTNGIMGRLVARDFTQTCDTAVIAGNYIKNIGLYAGMGQYTYGNTNGENMAMLINGDSNRIYHNVLDSIGYLGILWTGHNTHIHQNYFTNYCAIKDDGGAIMTNLASTDWPIGFNKGSVISNNIIINGIGLDSGSAGGSFASGIYMDANSKNIEVFGNLCYNGHNAVYYYNGADSINSHDNLFVNNNGNVFQYATFTGYTNTSGNVNKNNIFYTSGSDAYARALINFYSVSNLGTLDSNYYLKPASNTYPFTLNSNPIFYSQFMSFFGGGHDSNSSQSPGAVTSITPYILYNPTKTDSTFTLPSGIYAEPDGTIYNSSITLGEYQSKIVFKISVSSPKILNRTFRIQ